MYEGTVGCGCGGGWTYPTRRDGLEGCGWACPTERDEGCTLVRPRRDGDRVGGQKFSSSLSSAEKGVSLLTPNCLEPMSEGSTEPSEIGTEVSRHRAPGLRGTMWRDGWVYFSFIWWMGVYSVT